MAVASALLVLVACTSSNPPSASPSSTAPTTSHPATQSEGPPPRWQPLPKAPIAGRIGAGVVWTGHKVIVWGGVIRPPAFGTAEAAGDGAAYDPATNTWRAIATAPSGALGGGGNAAAWTSHSAVFWAGNSPDGPAGGAVYEPPTDSWRRLPDGPLGNREGYVSAWTGKELLIIGGTSGDGFASPVAAAVDPRTGSWRLLAGLNKLVAFRPNGAVWSGSEVFVAGLVSQCPEQGSSCGRYRPILMAYDPTTDATRRIDLTGAPIQRSRLSQLAPVAWTGSAIVLSMGDPSAGLVFYDPTSGDWRTGRAAPCPIADPTYTESAWIGDRWVIPCGKNRLQIYDPSADSWQIIAAGPSPMNSRFGGVIAWTGTDLIAWSGTVYVPGNPTRNSGTAISLGS